MIFLFREIFVFPRHETSKCGNVFIYCTVHWLVYRLLLDFVNRQIAVTTPGELDKKFNLDFLEQIHPMMKYRDVDGSNDKQSSAFVANRYHLLSRVLHNYQWHVIHERARTVIRSTFHQECSMFSNWFSLECLGRGWSTCLLYGGPLLAYVF